MLREIAFFVASAAWAVAGDVSYSVTDPCPAVQCIGTVMNDRGEIAGQYFNLNPAGKTAPGDRDGRGFESTRNGFIAPLTGDTGTYVLPRGINSAGSLAVEFGAYTGAPQAGAYAPESRTLVNLSSVAGWNQGSRAVGINDSGDVAAYSLEPGRPSFFGTAICNCGGYPIAFTNDRHAVFTDGLQDTRWNVSTPNSTDRVKLRAVVVAVSPGGHILEREQLAIPNYFVSVLGAGDRALPVGDAEPFAINDLDQLLVHTPEGDAIQDGKSRPQLLRDLVPASSPWKVLRGRALNNRGQILVDADDGVRLTSIILTPSAQ